MSLIVSTAPVLTPRTLDEALALRAAHPDAVPLAGGTDLMVYLESGALDPPRFLNLWGLPGLADVVRTPEGGLSIGALATHTDLVRSAEVRAVAPILAEACATVGALQIQNRGTLGGNIVNASPAGDTLPVLLALDATFTVQSAARGRREVRADAFWRGYRKMELAPDELLVEIRLPARHPGDRTAFRKVGTRQAQSISKVMLGLRIRVDADDRVAEARVAFGSVAATPVRAHQVEQALLGRPADDLGAEADLAMVDIRPIDDVRSTADYRRTVAVNILRSALNGLSTGRA